MVRIRLIRSISDTEFCTKQYSRCRAR